MDVRLLLYVVGLGTLLLILGLRHTDEPDEVEEEVENALDALLMYDMDEEDD